MAEKPPKKTEQPKKDEKQPADERKTMHVLTDGGIGKLAAKHGIDLVVVEEPSRNQPTSEVAALQDALKRETARADDEYKRVEGALVRATKAEREAQEWQSLAGQMEKELDTLKKAAPVLAGLPTSGWASAAAKALVEHVPADERLLLLGDLLALLAPHAGETGANEGAADTLTRKLGEAQANKVREESLVKECTQERKRADDAEQAHAKLQAAMVARRAPDAGWIMARDSIAGYLSDAGKDVASFGVVRGVEALVQEVRGFRAMLSPAPMVAVAVRDDSTKDLAERYSVGVLEWDGKAVKFDLLEGPARPWADLVRVMNHAVATRLVPPTFR